MTMKSLILLVLVSLWAVEAHEPGMMMTGATEDVRNATSEDQAIADTVKGDVEVRLGVNGKFSTFRVTQVRTQIVAGTNYFMKVDIGNGKFIHLRIWQHLPGDNSGKEYELTSVQRDQTESAPLKYFPGE